jgi:hypothetical protein
MHPEMWDPAGLRAQVAGGKAKVFRCKEHHTDVRPSPREATLGPWMGSECDQGQGLKGSTTFQCPFIREMPWPRSFPSCWFHLSLTLPQGHSVAGAGGWGRLPYSTQQTLPPWSCPHSPPAWAMQQPPCSRLRHWNLNRITPIFSVLLQRD